MKNLTFLMILGLVFTMIACQPGGSTTEEDAKADSLALAADAAAKAEAEKAAAEAEAQKEAEAKAAAAAAHYQAKQNEAAKNSTPLVHHEHAHVDAASTSDPKGLTDDRGYYFASGQWATFPGGQAALDKYLADNLKYPKEARDNSIEGTVFTALYVDENGNIVDVQFPGKRLGFGCEEEVARVVKEMPRWNPGTYNNSNVKSKFVVPVKFKLM